MEIEALDVPDAWLITPRQFPDSRGVFLEYLKTEQLSEVMGRPVEVAQGNCSVSARGVLRGLHYSDVPPGQAKYVTCVAGSILDVVVDLRVGSETFGASTAVALDDKSRRAIYISEGLGHAFLATSESATVAYLCSTGYTPELEHGIDPLDPALGIDWPAEERLILSEKDRTGPSLAEALHRGSLPTYEACRSWYASRLG